MCGTHLWADLDRDRRVGGSSPNQNDNVFYCNTVLVTHPKCYIETTDRRDFGGKPSKWRWGGVLSWKIPDFYSVGRARSKTAFFAFLGYLQLSCAQPTGNSFTPKLMVTRKAETLKVCFFGSRESVTRHLADVGPWRVPKSGHVTITKIEKLHTNMRVEKLLIQKMLFFSIYDEK